MATCWNCGEPIVFRHVDGVLKPIHLNGGWCSITASDLASSTPFRTVEAYVNPNAYCPVCGEKVFYFQSRYGGRVFFDDLGWPWPKHPCTDNGSRLSKSPPIVRGSIAFKDSFGKNLEIYDLDDLDSEQERHIFRFRNSRTRSRIDLRFSKRAMVRGNIKIDDFWDAPSFLLRKADEQRRKYRVEFISGRKGRVLRFLMHRAR